MKRPIIDRREILRLAAEADSDTRSIEKQLRHLRGEGPAVRGRAGERVTAALTRRGFVPPPGAGGAAR
jgi:hypothetical protein